MTFQELLPALTGATALTVFLLVVVGAKFKSMWYTKAEYLLVLQRAERAERRGDRAITVALKANGATDAMIEIVQDGQTSARPAEPKRGEW